MSTSAPPQSSPTAPPRYKLAIVTWVAAYPTITILLAAFKPLGVMALPLPLRTLLLTAILVPTMAFVLVPSISRIVRGWLRRSQSATRHTFQADLPPNRQAQIASAPRQTGPS